jgi:hypothetical protein
MLHLHLRGGSRGRHLHATRIRTGGDRTKAAASRVYAEIDASGGQNVTRCRMNFSSSLHAAVCRARRPPRRGPVRAAISRPTSRRPSRAGGRSRGRSRAAPAAWPGRRCTRNRPDARSASRLGARAGGRPRRTRPGGSGCSAIPRWGRSLSLLFTRRGKRLHQSLRCQADRPSGDAEDGRDDGTHLARFNGGHDVLDACALAPGGRFSWAWVISLRPGDHRDTRRPRKGKEMQREEPLAGRSTTAAIPTSHAVPI